MLVGGLILIVTLIQNPEGIAGTTYLKTEAKRARAAAGPAAVSAADPPPERATERELVGER